MSSPEVRAVLWDMDGVVADTARQHFESWQFAFRNQGVDFSEADFRQVFGQRNDTIVRKMIGPTVSQSIIYTASQDKEEFFRASAAREIRAFPGVIPLLELLQQNHILSAIASSAPLENIHVILRGLGIEDLFQALVYGLEVSEGKPSPQVFQLAARKLGADPHRCIVIEDAVAGVQAAKSCGMRCIAVTNSHPAGALSEADLIVDSLEKVTLEVIEKLFGSSGQPLYTGASQILENTKGEHMDRTLILVKPDAMERNLSGAILSRLEAAGLKIVAIRALKVDEALAHRHYAVHVGKPFFKGLIEYITSYPIIAAVFEGTDAVTLARKTMGATDPKKADAGTIRRDFGIDLERNSVHGSDSPENAEIEIDLYFKKSDFVER